MNQKTLRIRMLVTRSVSFDGGKTLDTLEAGRVYTVPTPYAQACFIAGYAEQEKSLGSAPETKGGKTRDHQRTTRRRRNDVAG